MGAIDWLSGTDFVFFGSFLPNSKKERLELDKKIPQCHHCMATTTAKSELNCIQFAFSGGGREFLEF